jgi:hypothetical protein
MPAVAYPGTVESVTRAGWLLAFERLGGGIVIDMFMLASASKDPSALSNQIKEVFTLAPS